MGTNGRDTNILDAGVEGAGRAATIGRFITPRSIAVRYDLYVCNTERSGQRFRSSYSSYLREESMLQNKRYAIHSKAGSTERKKTAETMKR